MQRKITQLLVRDWKVFNIEVQVSFTKVAVEIQVMAHKNPQFLKKPKFSSCLTLAERNFKAIFI